MSSRRRTAPETQFSLLAPGFENPDSKPEKSRDNNKKSEISHVAQPATKKPATSRDQTGRQPALPGIAVRGRPRLRVKRSASERAAASRSQREADGSRRVEVMLDPDTLAALDSLAQADGATRGEVVSRLIRNAHRRRRAIPAAARDGHA